ncbi:MAG: hypothetical protein Q7R70_02030 [Candidatus Diapherotrites archaeon]|nr:hypothetical protein [Candidatus Diapherotrites archaeon]
MANVSISANLFPYRLSMKAHAKLAGELTIEIVNNDSKTKLLTMDLTFPEQVSTDKSGMNRSISKQIKDVQPGAKLKMNFPVFLTQRASTGVFSGKLLISEQAPNLEYATANYSKEVSFRIID